MSERKAYFTAADRAPENGGSAANRTTTANTRRQLASDLIYRAEQVASAIKTMRTFDGTGHALDAMPHLQTTVDDLNAAWKALAQNVANFVAKESSQQKFAIAVDVPREPLDDPFPSKTWQRIRDTLLEKSARAVDDHLEASIARHPAGSALADLDAAEAEAAGEPPLPAPFEPPTPPKPAPPGPGSNPFRVHRAYPA